jgi:hypothetical protein
MKFVRSLAIAIALTGITVAPASAQNPFNINGIVPDPDIPVVNDPTGNVQELGALNSNTTKVGVVHADAPATLDFTNPNGQVDLRRIWIQTKKDLSNNDLWLYFAWERDKETGSGFISFEFQQNQLTGACVYSGTGIDQILPKSAQEQALIDSCNPWVGRKAGDFLILWDQQGSGLAITKRVFTQPGGPGTPLVLGTSQSLGTAVPAISSDGFFGEAAINLTIDVFPSGGTCVNFANIIPGTVTGNSDTADYKDTVLAAFPDISNCGSLTVTKVTEPVSTPPDPQSFAYTIDRTDGGPVRFTPAATALNESVAHGETDEHLLLVAGADYRLHETLVSGYDLVRIDCVRGTTTYTQNANDLIFAVVAGETTACTITNRKRQGYLRVIKHVVNNNGGTATASQFLMSLNDGTTAAFGGVEGTFGAPGTGGVLFTFNEGHTYSVTEDMGALAGKYTATSLGACAGAIETNVTKVCQITNDDIAASLTVIKHVVNDNGGTKGAGDFTMHVTATNPSSSSFAGAEAPGVTISLDAGSYSVSEGAIAGYDQTSAVGCSGTIANGETKTCTITNDDKAATLIVIKHVVNDNGGVKTAADFTMHVTGTDVSQAQFAGAEAPGVTVTLSAGTFSVTEDAVAGYTQTAAVGCSGSIANGETKTCTITNDDAKATPAGTTVMRSVLHDRLDITGLRAGAPDAANARVRFTLYSNNTCSAQVGVTEQVTIAAGVATTVNGVLVQVNGTFYWRAEYTGDQFNQAFTTDCGSEIVTVNYLPTQ